MFIAAVTPVFHSTSLLNGRATAWVNYDGCDRQTDGQMDKYSVRFDLLTRPYTIALTKRSRRQSERADPCIHYPLHCATQNTPAHLSWINFRVSDGGVATCKCNLPPVSTFIFSDFHALLKLRAGISAVLTTLTGFVVGWEDMVIEKSQTHKDKGGREGWN